MSVRQTILKYILQAKCRYEKFPEMKPKTDSRQKNRDGKRCISFWLPEHKFVALRTRLMNQRLNVQAWGERIAERELQKT